MDRRCSLLLVEDEDVLRMLVAQFLRAEGFAVCEAADGAEGVARFTEDGPFDMLLVDLNLPHLSGVEVCRRVRAVAPDQKILVCSAAIVEESERALRAVGVDQMLTKPYHPEALIAHIRREVGLSSVPTTTPTQAPSSNPLRRAPMLSPLALA